MGEIKDVHSVSTFINNLVKTYNYEKLPFELSKVVRSIYINSIPYFLDIDGSSVTLKNSEDNIICNGYRRIVVGDYGAYIEFNDTQANTEIFKLKSGQEFRNDGKFDNCKYVWYTVDDSSDCKIYLQINPVKYADYKPGMYYINIHEVRI